MNILAIESSGLTAGVAIVNEEKTVAEFNTNYIKNHSQTLMPIVEELLGVSGFHPNEVDYIACSSGPGSFTGLRIGAATAKGLALGWGLRIVPVPTLDGLAFNIANENIIAAPIMDAKRNQVYTAFYTYNGGKMGRMTDYFAEDICIVLERLAAYGKPAVFLGDGVPAYKHIIAGKSPLFTFAEPHTNMQRAASVGALALRLVKTAVPGDEFKPFYLRKPQAERELESKL